MKRIARMAFAASFLLASALPAANTFAATESDTNLRAEYTHVYLTANVTDMVNNTVYSNYLSHDEVEGDENSAAVAEVTKDLIAQADTWLYGLIEEGTTISNKSYSTTAKLSYNDGDEYHYSYYIIYGADIVSDEITYVKDLDFTVSAPTVGDEATASARPVVTNNSEGYFTVDAARWVVGATEYAADFEGTFAADTEYYARFIVTPTNGAKLSNSLKIVVNGAEPAAVYKSNERATVVVKFKTDPATEVDDPVEPSNPEDPSNPSDPETPSNPENPENPENPSDPDTPIVDPTEEPGAVSYLILDGGDATYIYGQEEGITIRADGDISKFLHLLMDDEIVDTEKYTLTEGSTIISFANDYLESLSEGVHTVTYVYNDGQVSTTLTVKKAPASAPDPTTATASVVSNPQTEDGLAQNFVVFAVSVFGLIGAAVYLNRALK